MKTRRLSLLAVPLVLAAACASGPRVETDFDRAATFANYRSYALMQPRRLDVSSNVLAGDALMRQRVETALRAEMTKKGWREVAADASPDLLVAVHGTTRQQVDVENYGYTTGTWGRWYTPAAATTSVRTYDEGTLVVDMVDPRERKMVWRGTATGALGSRKDVATQIPEAVQKVLADFPPR